MPDLLNMKENKEKYACPSILLNILYKLPLNCQYFHCGNFFLIDWTYKYQ